jgi:transposase-like protein
MHTGPLTDVPPVIQLDGIWVTIISQQEKIKPDKRQRQRKKRTGRKMVILVALGFWTDGRREILDWQIARSEDHQEWEVLVQRLWERCCCPEQGLQLVVRDGSGGSGEALALIYGTTVPEQRCIFHKLQNVATLERDFEQTLVFYGIPGLALQWIRTTSLLERTNRELRHKFRQAVTFGSQKGAEVAIYLQVRRLHARWAGASWWETSHALYFELRNLNP